MPKITMKTTAMWLAHRAPAMKGGDSKGNWKRLGEDESIEGNIGGGRVMGEVQTVIGWRKGVYFVIFSHCSTAAQKWPFPSCVCVFVFHSGRVSGDGILWIGTILDYLQSPYTDYSCFDVHFKWFNGQCEIKLVCIPVFAYRPLCVCVCALAACVTERRWGKLWIYVYKKLI